MKTRIITILALMLICSTAWAGDYCVELHWTAPSDPDVAGYLVFASLEPGVYDFTNPVWQGSDTFCQVDVEDFKLWNFVIVTVDNGGLLGAPSDEVSWSTTPSWYTDPPSKAIDPQIGQCSGG